MSGEANYAKVLQALRGETMDDVVAEIVSEQKHTIATMGEHIQILQKTIAIQSEALAKWHEFANKIANGQKRSDAA
jgi:hypothetical protein